MDVKLGSLAVLLKFLLISVVCVKFTLGRRFAHNFVTCGSGLKLLNVRSGVRLHSHDVKYGSGSGQQSVTAVDSSDDHNSYWQVRSTPGEECPRGKPINCDQIIRLTHMNTGKNLHSHHFTSPLSHNLEVSAFGDEGDGDDGDFWSVVCDGDMWERDEIVHLKHVVTGNYLHVTGDSYGRPIYGQREVSGYSAQNAMNEWKAVEGVYMTQSDLDIGRGSFGYDHDEF